MKEEKDNLPDWVWKFLNRRVSVEEVLFSVANGNRPMLTKEECYDLAMKLGVPDNVKGEGCEPENEPNPEQACEPSQDGPERSLNRLVRPISIVH